MSDKVKFEVMSIHDDAAEGLGEKHFPNSKHGLLAYDNDGNVIDKLEGHSFGQDQIVTLIGKYIK